MPLVQAILIPFLIALAASVLLTPLVRALARRLGLYVQPTGDRWHRRPVPMLGGAAIVISTSLAVIIGTRLAPLAPLLICSALMFAVGTADDLLDLSPATKLVAQMLIAALLLYVAREPELTAMPPVNLFVAFLWIVGITNAFNLLDNIDGLAAGIAAIAGIFYLGVLAAVGPSPLVGAISALVGAVLGFLFYNFHPASIFMGDGGSLFLGFTLAAAGLLVAPELKAPLLSLAAISVLILLIPIFDVLFVTLTRGLAGRSALAGGRDHPSHRLVGLGIGERGAVLVLYGLAASGGGVALGVRYVSFGYAAILIGLYLLVLIAVGGVLGQVDAPQTERTSQASIEPPLVAELTSRYLGYEVFLDLGLIALSYYVAFRIRFFKEPAFAPFLTAFAQSFPIVVGCQLAALWSAGKYRHTWRSFGSAEVRTILKGITLGVAGSVILVVYLYRFERYSRGAFVIDAILLFLLLVGSRVAVATIDDYLRRQRGAGRHVLIYGAGRGGALLVRQLLQERDLGRVPVGFIDDDPRKQRLKLEGLPVLGTVSDLSGILGTRPIAEMFISIQHLGADRLARVVEVCRAHKVSLRRLRYAIEDVGPVESTFGAVRRG